MGKQLSLLQVEKMPNGRWRVLSPLIYLSRYAGRIAVPRGFDTDFASVPRLPLMFWLLGDRGHMAATLHDYLYRTGRVTRATADAVFWEALELEANRVERFAFWAGVRLGGWASYHERHRDVRAAAAQPSRPPEAP